VEVFGVVGPSAFDVVAAAVVVFVVAAFVVVWITVVV